MFEHFTASNPRLVSRMTCQGGQKNAKSTRSAAATKQSHPGNRRRTASVTCGLALVACAASLASVKADSLGQQTVENGKYIVNAEMQFPAGWRKVPDPATGTTAVLINGAGGIACGLRVYPIDYRPVAQFSLANSFQTVWSTYLQKPELQVLQMKQSRFWTTAGGTTIYAGQALVGINGTVNSLVLFLAEGRIGGRTMGTYNCADANTDAFALPLAIASLSSLVINLVPVSGGVTVGGAGGDAVASAGRALQTQSQISNMSSALFSSHSSMMSSMYPANRR